MARLTRCVIHWAPLQFAGRCVSESTQHPLPSTVTKHPERNKKTQRSSTCRDATLSRTHRTQGLDQCLTSKPALRLWYSISDMSLRSLRIQHRHASRDASSMNGAARSFACGGGGGGGGDGAHRPSSVMGRGVAHQ